MSRNDEITVRALTRDDLDAVVALDADVEGRSRRTYFEGRLAAALREPDWHGQFAAVDGRSLVGHVLARVLEGEFGRGARGLRIEVVGVRPDARRQGVGKRLFDALLQWARRHGVQELHTQARWNQHALLGWLDRLNFTLAPALVVDRAVSGDAAPSELPVSMPAGHGPGHEIDYGARAGNDFERLARDTADVRTMQRSDLAEIVRVDRAIVGHAREAFIARQLDEALADSAIRVSLTARVDGAIVGFLMARADRGDFGRTEPVVVLDTIGVDPACKRRGVGRALMSQLFANLDALRIERAETVVAPRDFALLGLLYGIGFAPSQRLAFTRRVGAA